MATMAEIFNQLLTEMWERGEEGGLNNMRYQGAPINLTYNAARLFGAEFVEQEVEVGREVQLIIFPDFSFALCTLGGDEICDLGILEMDD